MYRFAQKHYLFYFILIWFQYLLWQHWVIVLLLYWWMSFISLDYEGLCNFISIIMTLYFVLIVLISHCTLCLWLIMILCLVLKTKTSNSCKMKILVFILEIHNYWQTVARINPQNNCKSLGIEPVMHLPSPTTTTILVPLNMHFLHSCGEWGQRWMSMAALQSSLEWKWKQEAWYHWKRVENMSAVNLLKMIMIKCCSITQHTYIIHAI